MKAPLEEVFHFFSDVENLGKLTPEALNFQTLNPGVVKKGAVFMHVMRPGGGPIPVKWTSLISEFNSPNSFQDIQVKGPYGHWRHEHKFWPCLGGTVIEDQVRWTLPLGILSSPLIPLFEGIHRKLFRSRTQILRRIFTTQ